MKKIFCTVFLCLFAFTAKANQPIDFYVGAGVGGGYDLYTRMLAKHISKHLPGNTKVIVKNLPGGAGIKAVNYAYNVASPDSMFMPWWTHPL